MEVKSFCKPRGIYADPIPDSLFDLFEHKIPFSDQTKNNIVGFNYELDFLFRPRILMLPKNL